MEIMTNPLESSSTPGYKKAGILQFMEQSRKSEIQHTLWYCIGVPIGTTTRGTVNIHLPSQQNDYLSILLCLNEYNKQVKRHCCFVSSFFFCPLLLLHSPPAVLPNSLQNNTSRGIPVPQQLSKSTSQAQLIAHNNNPPLMPSPLLNNRAQSQPQTGQPQPWRLWWHHLLERLLEPPPVPPVPPVSVPHLTQDVPPNTPRNRGEIAFLPPPPY
jgi:hypothetical protein